MGPRPLPHPVLHLVLADAELEMVPPEVRDHPQVRAHARREDVRPGDLLLDSAHHHAALSDLDDADRRGRPDIVHFWLLTVLESRAGKAGLVRLWLHTRGDLWVEVDPKTRLVKNLHRFQGLARQLLTEHRVGPKDRDLLHGRPDTPLADGLKTLPDPKTALDDAADQEVAPADLLDRFAPASGDGSEGPPKGTVVMGGFPRGPYRSADALQGLDRVALPGGPGLVWAVAGEVVAQVAARWLDAAPDEPGQPGN